jgi:hypothetical protein
VPTRRNDRSNRRPAVVMAIALAGLLLVGCGNSSGSDAGATSSGPTAEEYVAGACGAMTTWGQDFKTAAGELQTQAAAAPTLADKKAVFVSFAGSLKASTDTLVGDLEQLGTPAVGGGEHVSEQLVASFQKADDTLADAVAKAQALPTNDRAAFKAQVTAIGNEIGSLGDAFNSVGNMSNDALDTAFNNDATCTQMQTLFSS